MLTISKEVFWVATVFQVTAQSWQELYREYSFSVYICVPWQGGEAGGAGANPSLLRARDADK